MAAVAADGGNAASSVACVSLVQVDDGAGWETAGPWPDGCVE